MQAGEPKPTPTGAQPAQSPAEQLEGLRAWTAQLDRKLGVRTIAGAIAIVLALAAGIVGVVLATSAKDESATKTDVTALGQEVKSVGRQAAQAAENDIADLSDRIDALEARVSTIASSQRTSGSELDVARDDIDELRADINDLQSAVSSSNSGGSGGGSRQRRLEPPLVANVTILGLGRPTTVLRSRQSPPQQRRGSMTEGYCVKERKKVEIKDPQQVTMKNGRPAIQGTCPDCGTKIFKIGKLEA